MWMPFLVAGGVALALAVIGGLLTDVGPWYRALKKPALQPPDWLFGPAWTLILGAAAASAGLAWQAAPDAETQRLVVTVFLLNSLLHAMWSLLFFKLRRPDWALAEIVPFWLSILLLMQTVAPLSSTAVWLLVPYVIWVSFAAGLNYEIVKRNKPFHGRAKP